MKERNLIEDIQKTNFINERISERRERKTCRAVAGRGAWMLGVPPGYWECRSPAPAASKGDAWAYRSCWSLASGVPR